MAGGAHCGPGGADQLSLISWWQAFLINGPLSRTAWGAGLRGASLPEARVPAAGLYGPVENVRKRSNTLVEGA